MADNFVQIVEDVELYIDPNGAPGSILAQNHQNILKDILNKAGKYVGSSYKANKNITGVFSNGQMSFNNNALNSSGNLTFSFSKISSDNLDLKNTLSQMMTGNLIVLKDFAGRAAQYKFVSYTEDNVKMTYEVVLVAVLGNPNYTYQESETLISIFSFNPASLNTDIITLNNTRFRICKKPSNTTIGIVEEGDYVTMGRLEDALIIQAKYNTGDVNDFGILANNFTDGSYTQVKYVS